MLLPRQVVKKVVKIGCHCIITPFFLMEFITSIITFFNAPITEPSTWCSYFSVSINDLFKERLPLNNTQQQRKFKHKWISF